MPLIPATEQILESYGREFLLARLSRCSVRTATGCLEWTGPRDRKGYGLIGFRCNGRTRTTSPHRLAFLILRGALSPNLTIDHLCFNRRCFEPTHLDECSRAENSRRSPRTWNGANVRKVRCPVGHPLAGDNLVPSALVRGSRTCLICNRARSRAASERRAASRRAARTR